MTLVDRSVRRQLTAAMALAMALAMLVAGVAYAETSIAEVEAVPIDDSCNDVPDDGFEDVPETNTFDDEIECLKAYGFTEGAGDGTIYRPNGTTRRWQMVQFIARLAQEAAEQIDAFELPAPSDQGFNDIGELEQRFQDNINVMAAIGVVEGKNATTFAPFENVKRDQMASFINRLQGAIQEATGGDPDGFTATEDHFPDVPETNVHHDNIMGLAEAGIVQGKVDGDYDPHENVTRGQMSAFIMRHYEVNVDAGRFVSKFPEVDPMAGIGGVITSIDDAAFTYTFTTDDGEVMTVDWDGDDVFTIDGTAASRAAFEAQIDVGDRISFLDDTTDADKDAHNLVNTEAANDGTIGNISIADDLFFIIEPVSGAPLAEYAYIEVDGPISDNNYEVDGTAVGEDLFEDALNEGDTVEITVSETGVRTFSLTNQTVSGVVTNVDTPGGATAFSIDALGDDFADDQDAAFPLASVANVTIDGTPSNLPALSAELSVGDQATYARVNGAVTVTLVNQAPSDQSGTLADNAVVPGGGLAQTDPTDPGGDLLLVAEGGPFNVTYSDQAQFLVDGQIVTEAEFEDEHLTAGDTITYRGADEVTETGERISLSNQPLSGELADVNTDPLTRTVDVVGPDEATLIADEFSYGTPPAAWGGAAVHIVNGIEVTVGQFDAALELADNEDTITITDVDSETGTDLYTEYRLTVDNLNVGDLEPPTP